MAVCSCCGNEVSKFYIVVGIGKVCEECATRKHTCARCGVEVPVYLMLWSCDGERLCPACAKDAGIDTDEDVLSQNPVLEESEMGEIPKDVGLQTISGQLQGIRDLLAQVLDCLSVNFERILYPVDAEDKSEKEELMCEESDNILERFDEILVEVECDRPSTAINEAFKKWRTYPSVGTLLSVVSVVSAKYSSHDMVTTRFRNDFLERADSVVYKLLCRI